jgi:hypothetical protein
MERVKERLKSEKGKPETVENERAERVEKERAEERRSKGLTFSAAKIRHVTVLQRPQDGVGVVDGVHLDSADGTRLARTDDQFDLLDGQRRYGLQESQDRVLGRPRLQVSNQHDWNGRDGFQ